MAIDTLELVRTMVRIDSVNPGLVPTAPGETELARWLESWARTHDLETHWVEDVPGRPSVIVVARGTDPSGGARLLLNAHLDTVGVDGMASPFDPRVDGDTLVGRGALDMKAGLGAAMAALVRSRDRGLRGDVVLAAVADEEHASVGMVAALRALERLELRPAAAIVTEPTGLDVHIAHRGFVVMDVDIEGLASHTSQPERGANAVEHAGRILAAVAALDEALASRDPHPRVGRGIVQPGPIAGGNSWFVTPERCRLVIERRTVPGETDALVASEVTRLLEAAARGPRSMAAGPAGPTGETTSGPEGSAAGDDPSDGRGAAPPFATVEGPPGIRTAARIAMSRPPFETGAHESIVRSLSRAIAARLAREARLDGAPYWMDAALIAGAGIPTAVFGPSGGGMHAADEWLHIPSLHACEDVLLDVILDVCR